MSAKKRAPKRKPKRDDAEQSKRFIATGKALGADRGAKAVERLLKKAPLKKSS